MTTSWQHCIGSRRPRLRTAAPLARCLLRRSGARCGDGCALRPLRAPRRPCLRHRLPCRRPHRQLPPRSAHASSRWSRSRCARTPSAPSMPAMTASRWSRPPAASAPGSVTLRINSANPTVSTASGRVRLGRRRRRRLGRPGVGPGNRGAVHHARCPDRATRRARRSPRSTSKASRTACSPASAAPLPALSFEFTTIQRDVALRCLDRLASLGYLWLRHGAGREPGAHFRPLASQGRDGGPHRGPAARGQFR